MYGSSTIFKPIINYINQLHSLPLHSPFESSVVSCTAQGNSYWENFSFCRLRFAPGFCFCGQRSDCLRWTSNSTFGISATCSDLNPHRCERAFSSNYDPADPLLVFSLVFNYYRGRTTRETPPINDIFRCDVSPTVNSQTHFCRAYFLGNPSILRISADGQFWSLTLPFSNWHMGSPASSKYKALSSEWKFPFTWSLSGESRARCSWSGQEIGAQASRNQCRCRWNCDQSNSSLLLRLFSVCSSC